MNGQLKNPKADQLQKRIHSDPRFAEFHELHARIFGIAEEVLTGAYRLGEILCELKDESDYGEWGKFLKMFLGDHCSQSTAYNYMQLWEFRPELEAANIKSITDAQAFIGKIKKRATFPGPSGKVVNSAKTKPRKKAQTIDVPIEIVSKPPESDEDNPFPGFALPTALQTHAAGNSEPPMLAGGTATKAVPAAPKAALRSAPPTTASNSEPSKKAALLSEIKTWESTQSKAHKAGNYTSGAEPCFRLSTVVTAWQVIVEKVFPDET